MKKNICILMFIMSMFSIVNTIGSNSSDIWIIINICLILLISTLQIIKYLLKFNKLMTTFIQISICIAAMIYGFVGFEYLLPILMAEVFKGKLNIFISMVISLFLIYMITRTNFLNITIYVTVIALYLYELNKQYINNAELKEFNKGQRFERRLMEEKITSLEKHIHQSNIAAGLKERNFIAQQVHDHLGHRITSSLLQLEVTKETMDTDKVLSRQYLNSAMENLRDGMDEIRQVLRNIKPKDKVMALEDIKDELLKFQYDSGIKTILKIEGDTDRISHSVWLVLETNIREALTNASKYSKATEIKVSILLYNKIARIEVRDNGVGCFKINKGLGLKGMEERMIGIGGRIDFINDGGFIINMMFNLGDNYEH